MSMNPWAMPQKRIELPPTKKLLRGDSEQMIVTLEQAKADPLIDFYCEPNDEEDFAVFSLDESGKTVVTRVAKCITINGIRWHVVPGKNKLPKTVYEFLLHMNDSALKRRIQPGSVSLGHLDNYR